MNEKLQRLAMPIMTIVVFLTMLGAAWPVLFLDGSALAKNLEKRLWVDSVDDRAVAAAMEAELFGEEPTTEKISTYDPKPLIDRVRVADKSSAIICILLTAALPLLIRWKRHTAWLYLLPACWLLLNAYAVALNGGKAHAQLAIPAHATRWMLPIALALLTVMASKSKPAVNWLLRVACACTFAIHGWEAFQLHAAFQDLIYVSAGLIGLKPSPETIHLLLHCIGIMDFLLALSVILIHSPKLLYWMCFWGLITALSRPLSVGLDTWPEVAIRLANSATPWLLIALGLPAIIQFKKANQHSNESSPNSTPVSIDS